MKKIAIITLAVLAGFHALPASAIELGAGIAYYSQSGEPTPFIGLGLPISETSESYLIWAQDDTMNHVDATYGLPLWVYEEEIKFYADAGAGIKWKDFDTWRPTLLYGLSASGDVMGLDARASWSHVMQGGERWSDDVFALGVYLKR